MQVEKLLMFLKSKKINLDDKEVFIKKVKNIDKTQDFANYVGVSEMSVKRLFSVSKHSENIDSLDVLYDSDILSIVTKRCQNDEDCSDPILRLSNPCCRENPQTDEFLHNANYTEKTSLSPPEVTINSFAIYILTDNTKVNLLSNRGDIVPLEKIASYQPSGTSISPVSFTGFEATSVTTDLSTESSNDNLEDDNWQEYKQIIIRLLEQD